MEAGDGVEIGWSRGPNPDVAGRPGAGGGHVVAGSWVSSAAKPSRQSGWAGAQPRARRALALEEPRARVIRWTRPSPPAIRASQTGIRRGGDEPVSR